MSVLLVGVCSDSDGRKFDGMYLFSVSIVVVVVVINELFFMFCGIFVVCFVGCIVIFVECVVFVWLDVVVCV